MTFKSQQSYNTPPSILAFSCGNFYGRNATVSNEKVQIGKNDERNVPAGAVVCTDASGMVRFLPRVKATEKVTTVDATFPVSNPYAVAPGDVLEIVLPYSIVTVSAFGAGNTVTVAVDGNVVSLDTVAEDTDNAGVASRLATLINADRAANKLVSAVANGDEVYVIGNSILSSHDIAVTSNLTTLTLSHATGDKLTKESTAVGTVSSVDRVNGTITLTATSAVEFIQDVPVGVKVNKIHGISEHTHNMTVKSMLHLSLLTDSEGVYEQRLPYFDSDIADELPGIRFDTKF